MDKNSSFGKRNWLIVIGLVLLIALVAAAARLLPASKHEPPEDPETAAPLSSAERSLEQSVSRPTANGYLYIILNNRIWGIEALNEEPIASSEQILGTVRGSITRFVREAEQFDDLTMLCLEYKGSKKR